NPLLSKTQPFTMKRIFLLFAFSLSISLLQAQSLAPLSVEKIMRDPKWMGVSPSNIGWSEDSRTLYFKWNPENEEQDALYYINPQKLLPERASLETEQQRSSGTFIYSNDR